MVLERADLNLDDVARVERPEVAPGDSGLLSPARRTDGPLDPRAVLALQRMAGNAAVSQALGARPHHPAPIVQRDNEAEVAASAGEGEVRQGQTNAPSLVLQVGNERDNSLADAFLKSLRDNQPRLEAAAAMASPSQQWGKILPEVVSGGKHALQAQAPSDAIATNTAVMTALELYLVQGNRVSTGTSQFQEQYAILLANYGRLEGIAKNYAGMSLTEVSDPKGVDVLVENAAGASGHTTDELNRTYQALQEDADVKEKQALLYARTQSLEEMPAKLSTGITSANTAIATFDNVTTLMESVSGAAQSMRLRAGFAEAKTKLEQTKKWTDRVKAILFEGGKDALKKGAEVLVEAGGVTLSSLGSAAAAGGPAALATIGKKAADKLVLEPLTEAVNSALTNANAAVGVVSKADQLALQEEAEKQKQDASTVAAFQKASASLGSASAGMRTDVQAYAATAIEFDRRRLEAAEAFRQLGTAIETAATKRGKAGEGKALSEMLTFLRTAEEFVVQANAVTDIGGRELAAGPTPPPGSEGPEGGDSKESGPQAAAKAIREWDGKTVWWAEPYAFKTADGEQKTFYSVNPGRLSITSFEATPEEARGRGTTSAGAESITTVIPEAVANVEKMKAKVLAIRAAIQARVFGGGGG